MERAVSSDWLERCCRLLLPEVEAVLLLLTGRLARYREKKPLAEKEEEAEEEEVEEVVPLAALLE